MELANALPEPIILVVEINLRYLAYNLLLCFTCNLDDIVLALISCSSTSRYV